MKKLLTLTLLLLSIPCLAMEKDIRAPQEISDDLQLALVSLLSLDEQIETLIEQAYKVLGVKEQIHPLIQQVQTLLQEYTTQSERTSKCTQELQQRLQSIKNPQRIIALTELLSRSEAELQLRERHIIIHVNSLEQIKDESDYQDNKEVSCPTCLSDVLEHNTLALSCSHRYCLPCLKRLVEIALKDKDVLHNLVCKMDNCNKLFSLQDLKKLSNATQLQQLESIMIEQAVTKDANGKHCPNPQCSYIYFDERNGGPRSTTCPKCKFIYCSRCFKNHPTTIKCEDAGLEQWRKEHNAKACPKCTSVIEKNGGCNIMKCEKCKHTFCWICLKPRGHRKAQCNCPLNS